MDTTVFTLYGFCGHNCIFTVFTLHGLCEHNCIYTSWVLWTQLYLYFMGFVDTTVFTLDGFCGHNCIYTSLVLWTQLSLHFTGFMDTTVFILHGFCEHNCIYTSRVLWTQLYLHFVGFVDTTLDTSSEHFLQAVNLYKLKNVNPALVAFPLTSYEGFSDWLCFDALNCPLLCSTSVLCYSNKTKCQCPKRQT